MVDPYNKYRFATCGLNYVRVWEIDGKSLLIKDSVKVRDTFGDGVYVTAIGYIYYLLGDIIETDLIVGDNRGDIGLVTCGNYIMLKKQGHMGMINCLKITDALYDKLVVITAGEDEKIKFWDTGLNLISEFNIKMSGMTTLDEDKNFSIQSLDIYACEPPTSLAGKTNDKPGGAYGTQHGREPEKQNPFMLVGTRSGSVLEVTLTTEFIGLGQMEDNEDIDENSSDDGDEQGKGRANLVLEKILFHPKMIFRYHSTQDESRIKENIGMMKNCYMSHHPRRNVFVSIGNDNQLFLWDIGKKEIIFDKRLDVRPTCIRFSPDGDNLAVGFENGNLIFYDSSVIDAYYESEIDEDHFNLRNFEILYSENLKIPIINLEFSESGKFIAISLSNQRIKD